MEKTERIKKAEELYNQGKSHSEIANVLGVSLNTVYRYIRQPSNRKNSYTDKIKPHLDDIRYWLLDLDLSINFVCRELGVSRKIFHNYSSTMPELNKIIKEWHSMRNGRTNKGTTRSARESKRSKEVLYYNGNKTKIVDIETYKNELFVRYVEELRNNGLNVYVVSGIEERKRITQIQKTMKYDIICVPNLGAIIQTELAFREGRSRPIFNEMTEKYRADLCIVFIVDKEHRYKSGFEIRAKRMYLSKLLKSYDGYVQAIQESGIEKSAKGIKLAYRKRVF